MPKRIIEISSSGPDEFLQLIGGDPFEGSSAVGLRVPTVALPYVAGTANNRYLFNGCAFSIGEGAKARILGYRQLVTIGQADAGSGESPQPRFVEQEITSPVFRFPDGNVWMGLRYTGGPNGQQIPPQSPPPYLPPYGTSFRFGMGSSLLYESITLPANDSFYVDLLSYTPPNAGRPWGQPVQSGCDWLSLQTPWRTHGAWHALDIDVEGPDTIAVFISVLQSNPDTRQSLAVPSPFFPGGLSPEEQFLLNYPNAVYWRVGASLIVELS
jgi:hypothetical protein